MVRVPVLDLQPVDEAIHDHRVGRRGAGRVTAEIGRHRCEKLVEALLPAVGTEVRQPALLTRARDEFVGRHH
jgi:hypothetical protein